VIVKGISSEELHIVKPKATCHITRQASIKQELEPFRQTEKQNKFICQDWN